MTNHVATTPSSRSDGLYEFRSAARPAQWTRGYVLRAAAADFGCAVVAVLAAVQLRFDDNVTGVYAVLSLALPALWLAALSLAGGYDPRFIGVGSDEFHKVLNVGVGLTAAIAIFSYSANINLSRGYLLIALPGVTLLDMAARYALRKRLHKLRASGRCMLKVVAVGHELAVAALVTELRREKHHGLSVVAACVVRQSGGRDIAGVPTYGGLDDVAAAVRGFSADTVAVLACPEIDSVKLRGLAWELEKTGTDLCVAPALLDVAGPRTTIRPVAGLPLLHVDHPELAGGKQVLKSVFDKAFAASALILLAPLFAAIALAVRFADHGPVFFRQTRVGKDGRDFTLYKFRTMVMDAEQRKHVLAAHNEASGSLFKIRRDPRVTRPGAWLRSEELV